MTTETLKNPSAPTIDNPIPIGIDGSIQRLQLALSNLGWLQKSFGRARPIPRMLDNKIKVVEPMVYQGSQEYYPAMPNDNLKSYSFWRVQSQRNVQNYSPNNNIGGTFIFQDLVDLIVWVDLKALDYTPGGEDNKDFIYLEFLIRDVLIVLNKDPNTQVLRIFDDKAETIFSGYNLQDIKRDLLMYPYAGFRIEMNLRYQYQCYNQATSGFLLLDQTGFVKL